MAYWLGKHNLMRHSLDGIAERANRKAAATGRIWEYNCFRMNAGWDVDIGKCQMIYSLLLIFLNEVTISFNIFVPEHDVLHQGICVLFENIRGKIKQTRR